LLLFNHERYQSISVIICIVLLAVCYGCQSKIESLVSPGKQITREELDIELTALIATAEVRYNRLDQQDELKQALYQIGSLTAQTGSFNPQGLVTTLFSILGVGAITDNVRKRLEIKKLSKPVV
jgi:hypothetical protein